MSAFQDSQKAQKHRVAFHGHGYGHGRVEGVPANSTLEGTDWRSETQGQCCPKRWILDERCDVVRGAQTKQ